MGNRKLAQSFPVALIVMFDFKTRGMHMFMDRGWPPMGSVVRSPQTSSGQHMHRGLNDELHLLIGISNITCCKPWLQRSARSWQPCPRGLSPVDRGATRLQK